MKKLLIALFMMFAGVAFADTGTVTWYNEDLSSYETTTCTIGGDIILPTPPTKTGYTFVGWTSLLPDGYIQRQFIYMMDGSYLQTDIVPTYDCKIEMDFQTTSVPLSVSVYLLGGRTETYGGLFFAKGGGGTVLVDSFGNTSADRYTSSVSLSNNTRYKFIFNNKVSTFTSGGITLFTNTSTGENANSAALVINGLNNNGTVSGAQAGIYLYSFKAWNGQGELVADYVPAIQQGTVPVVGMYDVVSGTFFTNAGTGAFIAGPVVQ